MHNLAPSCLVRGACCDVTALSLTFLVLWFFLLCTCCSVLCCSLSLFQGSCRIQRLYIRSLLTHRQAICCPSDLQGAWIFCSKVCNRVSMLLSLATAAFPSCLSVLFACLF